MKPVNLLPQDARRAQASGERSGSAYVIVGVLGALLLMVLGYVVVSNQVTTKTNRAAAAEARATALESQAAQKNAFTDFATIKNQRLLSVSSIAATRFDWERFMRELAHIMPEKSWIQTADASTTGDTTSSSGGGRAHSGLARGHCREHGHHGRVAHRQPRGLRARPAGHRQADGPPAPALPRERRGAPGVRSLRPPAAPRRRRSTTAAPSTSSTSRSPSARPRP